jgi:hypothetical protein
MTFSLYHVHIRTEEPKATADWWVSAFNLAVVADRIAPWGGRSVLCRSENGLDVRFTDLGRGNYDPDPPPAPVPYDRLDHIGFSPADIDAEVERLVALGAERYHAPDGSPNVPGQYHFIGAPGNVIVELHPPPAGAGPAEPTASSGGARDRRAAFNLDHFHIRTEEPRVLAEWWVEALNFTIERDFIAPWGGRTVGCRGENGLPVTFANMGRGGYDPNPPGPMPYPRLDHIGFATEEIDAEAERLVALGAERYHAPNGEPNRPGKWQFLRIPGYVTIELNPMEDAFPERYRQKEGAQ